MNVVVRHLLLRTARHYFSNDLFASGDEPALVGTFGKPEMVVGAFAKPPGEAAIRVNGK